MNLLSKRFMLNALSQHVATIQCNFNVIVAVIYKEILLFRFLYKVSQDCDGVDTTILFIYSQKSPNYLVKKYHLLYKS
jgi:hypothetical protein